MEGEVPEAHQGNRTVIVKQGPAGYQTLIVPTQAEQGSLRGIDQTVPSTGSDTEIRIDGVSERAGIILGKHVAKTKFGTVTREALLKVLGDSVH